MCSWMSDNKLSIFLGVGFILTNGDSLSLNENVQILRRDGYSLPASGSITGTSIN